MDVSELLIEAVAAKYREACRIVVRKARPQADDLGIGILVTWHSVEFDFDGGGARVHVTAEPDPSVPHGETLVRTMNEGITYGN